MIEHWERGWPAVADDGSVCFEWGDKEDLFWVDINRDGSVNTLRKFKESGFKIEHHWETFGDEVCGYIERHLRVLYSAPSVDKSAREGTDNAA